MAWMVSWDVSSINILNTNKIFDSLNYIKNSKLN